MSGEDKACFLAEPIRATFDAVLPDRCGSITACHGFCIGPMECTRGEIVWETDYALTM